MWKTVTLTIAVGMSFVGSVFYAHHVGQETGRSEVHALWNQEKTETAEKNLEVIQALNKKVQEAQNEAKKREEKLRQHSVAAGLSVDRLQRSLEEADKRIATASQEAVAQYAHTVNQLFGTCTDRYRAVAESADRHASDALMMYEAWPQGDKP